MEFKQIVLVTVLFLGGLGDAPHSIPTLVALRSAGQCLCQYLVSFWFLTFLPPRVTIAPLSPGAYGSLASWSRDEKEQDGSIDKVFVF